MNKLQDLNIRRNELREQRRDAIQEGNAKLAKRILEELRKLAEEIEYLERV